MIGTKAASTEARDYLFPVRSSFRCMPMIVAAKADDRQKRPHAASWAFLGGFIMEIRAPGPETALALPIKERLIMPLLSLPPLYGRVVVPVAHSLVMESDL